MIKVLVIDNHPVFQLGLASILKQEPDFQVVGVMASIGNALEAPDKLDPDVITVDIFFPGADDASASLLKQKYPQARLFILTAFDSETNLEKAMHIGARGYLPKTVRASELVNSIRVIASGNAVVFSSTAGRALSGTMGIEKKGNGDSIRLDALSPREGQVLALVAQGASNKEIAARYYVSETTVKAHLGNILEKLHVKNRTHAVALAIEKGYLSQFSTARRGTGLDSPPRDTERVVQLHGLR
jgi:DNA-binding NarL/FixJ family response regulator